MFTIGLEIRIHALTGFTLNYPHLHNSEKFKIAYTKLVPSKRKLGGLCSSYKKLKMLNMSYVAMSCFRFYQKRNTENRNCGQHLAFLKYFCILIY